MKEKNNRISEILQGMQPIMEARFRESCKCFQEAVDSRADQLWGNLKKAVEKTLQTATVLQEKGRKGELQYLCFSFMEYGSLLDKIEIRIDALDSGFYLDGQEAAAEWILDFWQDRYLEDLKYLDGEMEKNVIRVQNYERMEMRRIYIENYNLAVFAMLKNLAELIMETVVESSVDLAGRFMVVGGKYMDKAAVLYERSEDEVFFHRNG